MRLVSEVRKADRKSQYLAEIESVSRFMENTKPPEFAEYEKYFVFRKIWKLTRKILEQIVAEIAAEFGGYAFIPPASTYHRFMSGLQGGCQAVFLTVTCLTATRREMQGKGQKQEAVLLLKSRKSWVEYLRMFGL